MKPNILLDYIFNKKSLYIQKAQVMLSKNVFIKNGSNERDQQHKKTLKI